MEIRLFLYYSYLLENYINKTYEVGLHTYKKIIIPDAEFYVLFNGKAKMDSSEKYKTNFVIGEQKIDFKTKFQSINYDDLSEGIKARKDALDMYAYLIKRYFDNLKIDIETYKEKTNKEISQEEKEKLSIIFDREEFRVMSTRTLTYEESLDLQYKAGVYYGSIEGEKRGEIKGLLRAGLGIDKIMELTNASKTEKWIYKIN